MAAFIKVVNYVYSPCLIVKKPLYRGQRSCHENEFALALLLFDCEVNKLFHMERSVCKCGVRGQRMTFIQNDKVKFVPEIGTAILFFPLPTPE